MQFTNMHVIGYIEVLLFILGARKIRIWGFIFYSFALLLLKVGQRFIIIMYIRLSFVVTNLPLLQDLRAFLLWLFPIAVQHFCFKIEPFGHYLWYVVSHMPTDRGILLCMGVVVWGLFSLTSEGEIGV